jgi:hypothetical protein
VELEAEELCHASRACVRNNEGTSISVATRGQRGFLLSRIRTTPEIFQHLNEALPASPDKHVVDRTKVRPVSDLAVHNLWNVGLEELTIQVVIAVFAYKPVPEVFAASMHR